MSDNISANVIRRLPKYLRMLNQLAMDNVSHVSSSELGRLLGFTSSQVRHDFSCFGGFGQQGYGYNVVSLRDSIADILGMNRGHRAIVVGVGNIGHSLIDNFCFEELGVNLVGAFDVTKGIVGSVINGITIGHIDDIPGFLKEKPVDFAVLCVPKTEAVMVADYLIANGIETFWNFTNVELTGPDSDVLIENMHFSDSLLTLSYYIKEKNKS
mgnify:FL=1